MSAMEWALTSQLERPDSVVLPLGIQSCYGRKTSEGQPAKFYWMLWWARKQRWLTAGAVQPGGREGSREILEHLVVCKEGLEERCKEAFHNGM